MRLRLLLAGALVAALASCSSQNARQAKVSPISEADLSRVVFVLCREPVAGIAHVLDGVQDASVARMQRIVYAMERACPTRLDELRRYDDRTLRSLH